MASVLAASSSATISAAISCVGSGSRRGPLRLSTTCPAGVTRAGSAGATLTWSSRSGYALAERPRSKLSASPTYVGSSLVVGCRAGSVPDGPSSVAACRLSASLDVPVDQLSSVVSASFQDKASVADPASKLIQLKN